MNIYYDADCGICNKCKNFVLKYKNKNSNLEFLSIRNSKYHNYLKKSIVVEIGENNFMYGNALRKIFSEMNFPCSLIRFFPLFILSISYIMLREIRNIVSKNNCEI